MMTEVAKNIVISLCILFLCFILSKFLKSLIERMIGKSQSIDSTILPVLNSLMKFIVYTVGIIVILDLFGVNTASIVTLLGTIGLAVGFALKDTLSNIAAGVMLLILRPFKVGDFIECSGNSGKVIEINLFTTILETADGIYISTPNGSLWGNSIKNFTKNQKRRMDIIVGISYNDSIDDAISVLKSIIDKEERILKEPGAQAMVTSMADSCVNVQLRCWCSVTDYWDVYWKLQKEVKVEIEAAGLSIPFPQRDLNVKYSDKEFLTK